MASDSKTAEHRLTLIAPSREAWEAQSETHLFGRSLDFGALDFHDGERHDDGTVDEIVTGPLEALKEIEAAALAAGWITRMAEQPDPPGVEVRAAACATCSPRACFKCGQPVPGLAELYLKLYRVAEQLVCDSPVFQRPEIPDQEWSDWYKDRDVKLGWKVRALGVLVTGVCLSCAGTTDTPPPRKPRAEIEAEIDSMLSREEQPEVTDGL